MQRMKTLLGPLLVLFSLLSFPAWGHAAESNACTEALQLLSKGGVLFDVRTPEEFAEGALPGAVNIPHDQIESQLGKFPPEKDAGIIVYCRSGHRSAIAKETLMHNGYTNILNAGSYSNLAPCWKPEKE